MTMGDGAEEALLYVVTPLATFSTQIARSDSFANEIRQNARSYLKLEWMV